MSSLAQDAQRLQALYRLDVLDTPAEPAFDEITRFAARLCEAPIAVVNLIDARRQWFKSAVGMQEVRETALDVSICLHTLGEAGPAVVVPDLRDDPRFARNPLVTGPPGLRAYAGALLRSDDGHALGTLCVLDTDVRSFSPLQLDGLQVLAQQVVARLEGRRMLRVAETRRAHEQLIARIVERLLPGAGLDGAIAEVSRQLSEVIGCEVWFRRRFEADQQTLVLEPGFAPPADWPQDADRLALTASLCAQAARESRPVVTEDAPSSDAPGAELLRALHWNAYVCHPLLVDGELLGTLAFASAGERRFDDEQLELLRTAAGVIAAAIRRERLAQQHTRTASRLEVRTAEMHALLETAPLGVAFFDRGHRYTRVNATLAAINGLPAESHLGRTLAQVLPVNAASVDPVIASVFESGRAVGNVEVSGETPAEPGVRRHWLTGFFPVHDARDAVAEVGAWVIEVSQAKRAEQAMREREEKYRSLFTSIDEGFCVIEVLFGADGAAVDYRYVELNPAFDHHSGLAGAQGHTARELAGAFDEQRLAHYAEVVRTRQPVRFEAELPQPKRWLTIHAFPAPASGPNAVAVLFRDVSDRRSAELRLRDAQARQEYLLELADALRPLGDPMAVQAVAARVLGQRLAAARVAYFEVQQQDYVVASDHVAGVPSLAPGRYPVASFGLPLHAAFRRGEAVVCNDVRAEALTAAERTAYAAICVAAHISMPLVKDGVLVGGLAVHASEPRAWSVAEVELVRETAERTWAAVERASAEEALREAGRNKDEFLATLAHELRNPLAPIRNALQLLRLDAGRAIPGEHLHDMLDRQVNHMVRLVDDLLEVSRISRGAIELQQLPLDLCTVVRGAVDTARPAAEAGGLGLALSLPDAPVPVRGDPVRLAQVLANLLNNAVRYTDAGGSIAVAARIDGEQAVVEVSDSGIGIAAEQLPRMFTMFGQLDRSDPRSQGGLGIGLALAQRLAQLHRGSLSAASAGIGRGSSFCLRLPLLQEPGALPAPDGDAGFAQLAHPRSVLVVDDNRDAADSTAMLLAALGADVRVEHDGSAALALLQRWTPEVVLLDLGMPGLGGLAVARRLRADKRFDAVRLVAVTGWGQQEDRARTRDAGFDEHLVKPVDPERLRALVEPAPAAGRR